MADETGSVFQTFHHACFLVFIRHLVAERVNLRLTPELIFKLDESAEYAVRMEQLMAQIAKDREEREVQKDAE